MRSRVIGSLFGATGLVFAAGCGASAQGPVVVRPPALLPTPPPPAATTPRLDVTKILAFGDSLTEGAATPTNPPVETAPFDAATPGPAVSYPYKLQGLLKARYPGQNISVFNGGRGGDTAATAKVRFVELLDRLHPDVVILMDGVNDLNSGAPVEDTAGAVFALIAEAKAHDAKVLVATIPRQRPGGQRAGSVEQVVPFDQALAKQAAAHGIDLVDIYPEIPEPMVAPDGLHLVESANQRLAEMFFDALRSKFEAASTAIVFFENLPNHVHRLPL